MPLVEIMMNDKPHAVMCDDGQEARVRRLAAYVDGRITELKQGLPGKIPDGRLMVLGSLMLADELSDAYDEVKRLQSEIAIMKRDAEKREAARKLQNASDNAAMTKDVADRAAKAADKLERLADRAEKT